MQHDTIYKKDGKSIIANHYDSYLSNFGCEIEQTNVNTNVGDTHVLVAGPPEGKPVIVFQGGNCINPMTLSWFLPLIKTYRIYAPDTIGHPGYSEQRRISAKDDSFAKWATELMDHFSIERAAVVGPSYGAGIILRLATFSPERIACSVLVSPAGLRLGSKSKMVKDILFPLGMYQLTKSEKHLIKLTDRMSDGLMQDQDRRIIGDVFNYVRLEQDMPKLTTKKELSNYHSPTLVIAGTKDVFFPESKVKKAAEEVIPNLTAFKTYEMGHFPSIDHLAEINEDILLFLKNHY
ncbi:MAG: alpha/beta fold hydrolase [Bacillota bacterium]